MKLRNKKTGEIEPYVELIINQSFGRTKEYSTLKEFCEEWEDYKPKINNRFRLVKDLPTFKAGQEFYLSPKGNLVFNDGKFGPCAYAKQTLEKFPNILEEWFEPIDDEGADALNIEPQEPLIKDEKIRKAVRTWAEANDYGRGEEYQFEDFSTGWKSWSLTHHNGDDNEIHFNGGINLKEMNHQGYYTIAELCGQEEDV